MKRGCTRLSRLSRTNEKQKYQTEYANSIITSNAYYNNPQLSDQQAADQLKLFSYDRSEPMQQKTSPYLQQVRPKGVKTVTECKIDNIVP